MVMSLCLAAIIAAIGYGLTAWVADRLRFEERLAIGVVVGVLAVSVTSFVAFELIGMGSGAVTIGIIGARRRSRRGGAS